MTSVTDKKPLAPYSWAKVSWHGRNRHRLHCKDHSGLAVTGPRREVEIAMSLHHIGSHA